jgi:hypothetical protein
MMGTSTGFGLQASVSYDDGEFYFGVGYGISYYSNYNGMGINGWEHRASGMAGFGRVSDFRLSLGTNLWWGMKGLDNESLNQQTGVLSIKSGDFGMTYENDGMPFGIRNSESGKHEWFSPRLGDGGDSHRSASASLSIGEYSVGFNIFTGKRSYDGDEKIEPDRKIFGRIFNKVPRGHDGGFGANLPYNEVTEIGRKYRLGVAYISYKGLRLGVNSYRYIGHPIQNIGAHYFMAPQQMFTVPNNSFQPYFQYSTPNIFTLW